MKRLMVCAFALGVTLSGGIALAAPGDPDPGFGTAGVVTGGLLDTDGALGGRFVGPHRRGGYDRWPSGVRPLHRDRRTRHGLLRRWPRRARVDRHRLPVLRRRARSLTVRPWWRGVPDTPDDPFNHVFFTAKVSSTGELDAGYGTGGVATSFGGFTFAIPTARSHLTGRSRSRSRGPGSRPTSFVQFSAAGVESGDLSSRRCTTRRFPTDASRSAGTRCVASSAPQPPKRSTSGWRSSSARHDI